VTSSGKQKRLEFWVEALGVHSCAANAKNLSLSPDKALVAIYGSCGALATTESALSQIAPRTAAEVFCGHAVLDMRICGVGMPDPHAQIT
jgi:hypothetical protein